MFERTTKIREQTVSRWGGHAAHDWRLDSCMLPCSCHDAADITRFRASSQDALNNRKG